MLAFTLPDDLALGWFLACWIVYSLVIEKTGKGATGLNALMNDYRDHWMEQMLAREVRIVNSQVTAALQNGTAFFASTSLIAIGGTLTLMRATDQILTVIAALPFSVPTTHGDVGIEDRRARRDFRLCVFQIRLVVPAVQLSRHHDRRGAAAGRKGHAPKRAAFVHRASQLCAEAGLHFNRGQRAFFFALGYLGWFLGPLELALSTTGVLIVMWRRQFASPSRKAFEPSDRKRRLPASDKRRGRSDHAHQNRDRRHDHHRQPGGDRGHDAFVPVAVDSRNRRTSPARALPDGSSLSSNVGCHGSIPL